MVTEDSILNNPYAHEGQGKGIQVANWLLEHGLDRMVVARNPRDKGPGLALSNAGTEIRVVAEQDSEKALVSATMDLKKLKDFRGGEISLRD